MSSIKAGDVVSLKSGGPNMTCVEVQSSNEKAFCIWFLNGKVEGEWFAVVALEPAR